MSSKVLAKNFFEIVDNLGVSAILALLELDVPIAMGIVQIALVQLGQRLHE